MQIIPVEVKAGDVKYAPTFKRFVAEKNPDNAIRFSKLGYLQNNNFTNMPLYLARKLRELL